MRFSQYKQEKAVKVTSFFWFENMEVSGILLSATAITTLIVATSYCCCSLINEAKTGVPARWPLVGMLPSLFMNLHHVFDWLTQSLLKTGGTFMFEGSPILQPVLFTSDPKNVKYIVNTKFSSFLRGDDFKSVYGDILGDGILNVDGESWAFQRRAALAEFSSVSGINYAMKSLQDAVRGRLMPILESACFISKAVDLQDIFLRFAFDQVCKFTLGVDTACLSPDLPDLPFVKALEEATTATTLRIVTPMFVRKIGKLFGLGIDARLHRVLQTIDGFAAEIISSRRKELKLKPMDEISERRADLLSIFMDSRDGNGDLCSDKFLRDICLNFIIAGREATSVALSWFFWLVLRHPHVEEKIVEEIRRVLKERPGSKAGKYDPVVCFSREELKRMHYLHACLTESMRLYPPVPANWREAAEDLVLPDGTPLKRGTVVCYVNYAMGRMESVWGKDCREFKPERWLHNGGFVNQSAYKFTAFNGGPRMCVGKDLAYLQMKHVAASILYRFRLKMVNEQERDRGRYKLSVTLYKEDGLIVTLHAREIPDVA